MEGAGGGYSLTQRVFLLAQNLARQSFHRVRLHSQSVSETNCVNLGVKMVSLATYLALVAAFTRSVSNASGQSTLLLTTLPLEVTSPPLPSGSAPTRQSPHTLHFLPRNHPQATMLLRALARPPLQRSIRLQLQPPSHTSSPRPWTSTAP
jgi:hypothetical protein